MPEPVMIRVLDLAKTFVVHLRGGVEIPVFADVRLEVRSRECVVLDGPSGVGKSTLLRSIYANYRPSAGQVLVRHGAEWVDMVSAPARRVIEVRRRTIGYVSQFLRVIPRIPTIDLVRAPLLETGVEAAEATRRASEMLERLNLPASLWDLPPATFSGGEQQRVNIARSFIRRFPVLLLDEPTASLDAENRDVVADLIRDARDAGTAIVAIFHDRAVRDSLVPRLFDVQAFRPAA